MRLLILLVATALSGSAEEVVRNSRLRFPSEIPQQVDLGPQLFESETQVLPMVIPGNAAVNTPHLIYAKQAPSTINPFGQIGHKPYSEGLILPYYQPPERPQTEFHQTMPPPLRATPYGPPKAVASNLQGNRQSNIQSPHRNQERQPERHRFGSHRVPLIQQTKQKPQSQYPPKQHRPSSQYHKDVQHQQPDTMFKYSILTNHNQPSKNPHTEKFEQDFFKSHKQPTYIKNKRPANHQKQPYHHDDDISDFPEDSSEFDQGIPDWQIKGNFYDTPEEHDSYFYKKNKKQNPHSTLSSGNKHHFNSDFSFSHDFSDFPSFQGSKNTKRYPHIKSDSNKKRGEIKAVYEPSQEHISEDYSLEKYFPKSQKQRDRTKSQGFPGHENYSGEKFYSDYDFSDHFHSQHDDEPINSNFGSEWIPINAPEGVPAKSYDIPAPDLSRGGFKDRNIIRREYPHDREDSNLVYGVQKPSNSEEVVSAVVRVKQ